MAHGPVVGGEDHTLRCGGPHGERRRLGQRPSSLRSKVGQGPVGVGLLAVVEEQLAEGLIGEQLGPVVVVEAPSGEELGRDHLGQAIRDRRTRAGRDGAEEDHAPHRSVGGDDRDGEAAQGVAHHDHVVVRRADRRFDDGRVLGDPGAGIVAGEVGSDDGQAEALQLGYEPVPAPCAVMGAVHERDGGHRRREGSVRTVGEHRGTPRARACPPMARYSRHVALSVAEIGLVLQHGCQLARISRH